RGLVAQPEKQDLRVLPTPDAVGTTLSANMSETPTPRKFNVEGESGNEDVDQSGGPADGGGDGSGGEGGTAAVHGRREAAGAARGGRVHEARRVERVVTARGAVLLAPVGLA